MTKQVPAINLLHAIICDDIRREDNGKFILIWCLPGSDYAQCNSGANHIIHVAAI